LSCFAALIALTSPLPYVVSNPGVPRAVAVVSIAVAILVRESWSLIGDKALATGGVLVLIGPVVVHTTVRSFRTRKLGDWREGIEKEAEKPQ